MRKGTAIPPSLRNIYKEIKTEYPDFEIPKHGSVSPHLLLPHSRTHTSSSHHPRTTRSDLTPWAQSGVLLLNTALTVRAHTANSHSGKGWETFTDKLVDLVDRYGGADGEGAEGKG